MPIDEDAARAFVDGVNQLDAIINFSGSSATERADAEAARTALTGAWKDEVRADFNGRTAALNLLVARLTTVSNAIVTDPLQPIRDSLNQTIDKAKAVLAEIASEVVARAPLPGAAPSAGASEAEAIDASRALGDGSSPTSNLAAADLADADPPGPPAPPAALAPALAATAVAATGDTARAAAESPVPDPLYMEYAALFASAVVRSDRTSQVATASALLMNSRARYVAVETSTRVPWWVIGLIHGMESGFRSDRHLHNGDPLTDRTTRVPAGRPDTGQPPFTWEESARDALVFDGLSGWPDWSIPAVLYKLEKYNGWGYRKFHPEVLSPYLWSFTNHYSQGKYVADGRFSATAVSQQVGAAAMLRALVDDGHVALV